MLRSRFTQFGAGLLVATSVLVVARTGAATTFSRDAEAVARPSAKAVVVLAGGCYWGVESVFRHVRGVKSAVSGFATPVGGGDHAEAVRISYDPEQLSYNQILEIFFSVVHDPTQLNRQGPDVGTEYRSIVFVDDPAQGALVKSYVDSLGNARTFSRPIVTEIDSLDRFEPVPASQQNYAAKHPNEPYIVTYDAPLLRRLQQAYPDLYRERD